jgi:hypothetical protein
MDKIEKYCKQDVKVTKDVYEYALKHQKLKYKDLLDTITFDINTSNWDKNTGTAINYTLPL